MVGNAPIRYIDLYYNNMRSGYEMFDLGGDLQYSLYLAKENYGLKDEESDCFDLSNPHKMSVY